MIRSLRELVILRVPLCRHLAGEDLLSLGIREIKQLERQMRTGLERIRNRKAINESYALLVSTMQL